MIVTGVSSEMEQVVSPAVTTRMVLVLEYDGSRYYGFQLQDGLPTIQGEIEKALTKLTGESIRVVAASRTDTGVHARGQVVSFRTESPHAPQTFVSGLNYYLPRDIAVKSAHRVGDSFNVRRHAISRQYSYYMLNGQTRSPLREGFCYLVSGRLDTRAMNEACQLLVGEHDFTSFTSGSGADIKNKVRQVYRAEIRKKGELSVFNIIANSFLSHQVRNTVGCLMGVGLGKMSSDEFRSIMEARRLGLAGPTAPACGLYLVQVNYPHPLRKRYDKDI